MIRTGETRGYAGEHNAYADELDEFEPGPGAVDVVDPARLRMILEWWRQTREAWAEPRAEMALDEDFADGDQISDEDRATLIARGQPPVTMNLIKPSLEWIVGTEMRMRTDYRAYPRRDDEESNERALVKTKLLKYNSDVNRCAKARSGAARDAATVGVGWFEDGVRNDDTDEITFSRRESWRNVWLDHLSVEPDVSDARYLFRDKTVDLDIALAMFPGREAQLRASVRAHGDADEDEDMPQVYRSYDNFGYRRAYVNGADGVASTNRRERVRLVECWYRVPRRVKKMRDLDMDGGSPLAGRVFDAANPDHAKAEAEQVVSLYDAMEMEMRCLMFCEEYGLADAPSPYRHNRLPFTPIWCFRRGRDNMPFGFVRNLRDAQRDHNARFSKALFILSTNRVIAERGIVEDEDELERTGAKPNGVIWLRKNASKDARFEIGADNKLAEEHLMLMQTTREYMTRSSGVTDENMGRETNAQSGRAVLAKQEEGAVVLSPFFDNIRFAQQLQGEKQLSNIEQFFDLPKQVRIVGDNAKHEFVSINQPEWDPIGGGWVMKNDITSDVADFRIDTADFRQSVRQAQFESLSELVTRFPPEIALQMLDLLVDLSDVSNKEELVKRIRKVNGQSDADEKLAPEEIAEREAEQAQAAEDKALIKADAESVIAEREAKTAKLRAEATETNVEAVADATEAAATMATMPAVAPITDQLLVSAGFVEQADIASIAPPAPPPAIDPQAQAEASEHARPAPTLDPNRQYETDSRERVAREKADGRDQTEENTTRP